MFGLSTLNSNRTKSQTAKENSQSITPTYFFATLRDSNTILCTNSQTLYIEGLECLRRRLQKGRQMRFMDVKMSIKLSSFMISSCFKDNAFTADKRGSNF